MASAHTDGVVGHAEHGVIAGLEGFGRRSAGREGDGYQFKGMTGFPRGADGGDPTSALRIVLGFPRVVPTSGAYDLLSEAS